MLMVRSVGFKTKLSVGFSANCLTLKLVVGNLSLLSFLMIYDNTSNDIGPAIPAHIFMISKFPDEEVERRLDIDQSSKSFKAETWIKNLKCAFHVEEIDVLFCSSSIFCMRSISDLMRGVRINKLRALHDFEHFAQLLDIFYPPPNELFLISGLPDLEEVPASYQALTRKVFMQNFRFVILDKAVFLNDLLVSRVPRMICESARLSNQELNIFIKLWLKSECRILEHLYLDFPFNRNLAEDVVFKGISHVGQPVTRVKVFEHAVHPFRGICPIQGGCDITRRDGTTATIVLRNDHFRMIVWI
ncbi:hypothetical protein CAEBREN_16490 [Caenorhabditis brenneri]|uniref:Sdz-33 F-box domain-containing protein n=1 Tax=Caenorhabditis brenneri TaxID=135651 RepID=G0N7U9_CAEBE|nr:hypothetical protein CAEBREN_16490 [Caenorhabditis brenneri]